MAPNTIPLLIIGGVIIVLLLAWLAVRALLRRDDEEELPDFEPEEMPAVPAAPARPAPAPVTPPPPPARPVTPPEPSIYTYPGLRGGWWVCPNCACENEPDRTRCSVCLWDRSVGVS